LCPKKGIAATIARLYVFPNPQSDTGAGWLGSILEGMGKVWILSTETKGTGANMVPLERVTRRSSNPEPLVVAAKPRPRPPDPPAPRAPRRFRVVDVMTRQAIVQDAGVREVIDALAGVRSIVDVDVYLWQEERERWRLLTFSERHAMWELAEREGSDSLAGDGDRLRD
jgi:hypothetical protein